MSPAASHLIKKTLSQLLDYDQQPRISVDTAVVVYQARGWPLQRRESFVAMKESDEARKMSVVQWVMSLPSRSLPSPARSPVSGELERIFRVNGARCRWLLYDELKIATSCFSSDNLIGDGGSSRVYKGCLPNGDQVAIKIPKRTNKASIRDFILEVNIMSVLRHRYIMPLIGICIEDDNLISVYSYFSKGNLEENLHGVKSKHGSTLSWDRRFKVAIKTAEALSYLHSGCSRPVIHRDVKSSNILLSDEFEPKLSDFNLALWAPTSTPHLTHSDVLGTFGYLAPEYFMYGRVSDKIDVYAFGVVLLELLTGRKPIHDDKPKGQESLVIWATPILERGDVKELLDPNLCGKYDDNEARRMALAASLCITRAARLRPAMYQVLRLLLGEEKIEVWMNSHPENTPTEQDDEAYVPASSVTAHLGLALLDVDDDDDNASVVSSEQNHVSYLEEYLKERCNKL